jgi:hypothetical protein
MSVDPDYTQALIQQFYENESLTNALTDEGAKFLLEWGERQIESVAPYADNPDNLADLAQQLERIMRAINRAIELKATLTDEQMAQRLLTLVEQAIELGAQKSTFKANT